VFDSVINYLDKFGPELLVIQFGFLVILFTLFLWLWFANRRKYHNLKHAIPANVVKNYLDSIIQNSTALKSSLFRGGGLELNGIPSVLPLQGLSGGEGLAVSGAPSTALLEELNQKKAQIASLESQLSAQASAQRELEAKFQQSQSALAAAEARIKELEALLAQARSGAGGDAGLKAELASVTKERDEIRDRLKEFEIIADDLANLKRLQQENEQLKRSLAAQGGSVPQAVPVAEKNIPTSADVSDLLEDLGQSDAPDTDVNALEEFLSSPTATVDEEPQIEDTMADEIIAESNQDEELAADDNKPKSDKTPEDLLSEFEKMLG
jgi:predicted nuclease with TOPRIM domain